MKDKEILLILDSNHNYLQKVHQYESIDVEIFMRELERLGYKVHQTNYFDVALNIDKIKNKNIVYTSNQDINYKKYIEDIIYILKKDNFIIPGYDSLIGHENKAYQELQRKNLHLDSLKSYLISSINDLNKIEINYPIIVKRPNSCSSKGVFLANNEKELKKIINTKFIKKDYNYYLLNLKKIMKKILHKKDDWTLYKLSDYHYTRFILQEFIPNLDGDYKILVYGNKYYGLKRGIKKGDFRASGSGIHNYKEEIPKEVLDFARSCFLKLDIPFAGFDIAIDAHKKCYLIEYQSIHIGPVTLIHSEKYYTYEKNKWQRHQEESILEEEYARAIDLYFKKKKEGKEWKI